MRTKNKLTIGREYYLGIGSEEVTGVLVAINNDEAHFKCTSSYNPYILNKTNLVSISECIANQFKEVPMKEEKYSNRKSCLIILLMTAVLWGCIILTILAL